MTLINHFFRKLILSLFVPLQTIQLLSKMVFYKLFHFQDIQMFIKMEHSVCVCVCVCARARVM